jgi:hypothetical protein
LIPLCSAELQCKSSVWRKNRLRVDANEPLKTALKHDGILGDRTNPANEFGVVECSPLQSNRANSSKWLGDLHKMRKPQRDMLSRLMAEVDYDRSVIDKLQVFAFNFSALTMQVSRMTQQNGYVCLLNAYDPVTVPQSLQQFSGFLKVLCHVVQIKVSTSKFTILPRITHRLIM